MNDAEKREKVIFALRYCRENMCGPECPYYYDDINESPADCILERVTGDVLALLKEQEARVLTFKEVETSKGFVWVEFNSTNENRLSLEYVNVRAIEGFRDSFALTTDSGIKWFRDRGDYNRGIWFGMNSGWRCWTSRPSPEQMRDTKWEEK